MKADEFVNFVNLSIASKSGLRHITAEDLRHWHEIGFFKYVPEYHRAGDFEIVIALLKNEADLRQRLSSPLAQPAQTYKTGALEGAFQRGITQVVSCVGSGLIEEQLIIQGLKDTNLIGSAVDDRLTELRYIAAQKLAQLNESDNSWMKQVKSLIEIRDDLERHIETLESEVKAIEAKIEQLPEADVGFLKEQRKERLTLRENLILEQNRRQGERDRLTREKKSANDQLNALLSQQKKYQRVKCRLDATNDISDVIVTSYKTIEENEIPRVCSAMNEYFMSMIQADPEHSIIRRADVTNAYDIAVYGPEDRRLDTDIDLNGASRRALTLAFILALAEVSGVKAPNVIDTPLGMMSGIVKQSVLRTAVNHAAQLVLFLTRDEISGCQDIIDKYAGKVCTLTNSAHYPKQLVNKPSVSSKMMIRCDCNHRQYCSVCERIGDRSNSNLKRR